MAAPNIVNVSTIYGKTAGLVLTNSAQDVVVNGTGSNKILKVNAVYVTNTNGSVAAAVTVNVYKSANTFSYRLANTISVVTNTTLDIISKSIYLEEGDKITALIGATGNADIIVSYEDIS